MGRPKKKVTDIGSKNTNLVKDAYFAPIKKDMFVVKLQIGNETYNGSGETMIEALNALALPPKFFLKGILDISHGDKHKNMLLPPMRIKRLFMTSPSMKNVVAKQLTTLIS